MSHSNYQQKYFDIHSARYEFLISYIKNLMQSGKILDIGAYPPFVYNELKKNGYEVYGVASSHERIKDPNIKILNIENETLPWNDSYFDIIVFTEVLEHLPHSAIFPLKEMHRVLKKDGHLLLSTPNALRIHSRLGVLFGKSNFPALYQHMEATVDSGKVYHMHHKEYTFQEVKEYLFKTDFEINKSSFECFYPPSREAVKKASFLSQLTRWVSYLIQISTPKLKDSLFFDASPRK